MSRARRLAVIAVSAAAVLAFRRQAREARVRRAARPARTQGEHDLLELLARAGAPVAEQCCLTVSEYLEFRRITGRVAGGPLAKAKGQR